MSMSFPKLSSLLCHLFSKIIPSESLFFLEKQKFCPYFTVPLKFSELAEAPHAVPQIQ